MLFRSYRTPCLPFRACLFAPAFSRLPFRACLFAPAFSRLIVSLALLLSGARFCTADTSLPPLSWDANTQGRFVTALCRDRQNRLWVGGEDGQGLWAYDPATKSWTHYPASPDLSGDIYALACDRAGRIWAGGLSGVSVYNGQVWRQYGPADGPLGSRLFALAVSPKDGSVWGATEAGLFRYGQGRWSYFTRAEGLPSDQAQALAFAPDGTLYVGTQCDGIAVGSPHDGYKTWRITPGPRQMPNAAGGKGLPSGLINCLLVSRHGTVYAGTPCGLAWSRDSGDVWHYRRGANWKDKLAGLYRPLAPDLRPAPGDLLAEDYVTCLGEDASGRLFVGHRQGGVEAFDQTGDKRVQSGANGAGASDYISALLVTGGSAFVGLYGGGLLSPAASSVPSAASISSGASSVAVPPLPVPAAPPSLAELRAMLARVQALKRKMPVGGGAYLGEDWRTLGDWVGRYGRQYAVLCAVASPMDQVISWDSHYAVEGQLGPHHTPDDAMRHWIQPGMFNTPRLASLYSPVNGYRIQAEWDDHGETYPQTFEGPDVWVTLTVPEGVYRLSLYDTNKDGHDGDNCLRDYQVDLLPYRATIDDALTLPPLAHTRIHNFWNGQYVSFLIRGPSKYYVRLAKNGSKNTILAGVFIDKLKGPKALTDNDPLPWLNDVHYDPPDPDVSKRPFNLPSLPPPNLSQAQRDELRTARTLWDVLSVSSDRPGSAALQQLFLMLAYRTALADGGSDELCENWRWMLSLWTEKDRDWFERMMAIASRRGENPSWGRPTVVWSPR